MQSQNCNPQGVSFPWTDTKVLIDKLKTGDLCLTTVISQFGVVMRETLRIIEDFSCEQAKLNLERKNKLENIEKLVGELSEKCQAMQQALLYKEEKYDEKCREVERYKVIFELAGNVTTTDEPYYTDRGPNNNNTRRDSSLDFLDPLDEDLGPISDKRDYEPSESGDSRRHLKTHVKVACPASTSGRDKSSRLNDSLSIRSNSGLGRRDLASDYVGGPCKRKRISDADLKHQQDHKFHERLAMMGGVNVKSPRSFTRPVPIDKICRPNTLGSEDQNKRCKISLVGQCNEVVSSSRNAVDQMRQKFTQQDLHRQVASGCWTRLASRRKKEWPF